MIWLLGILGLMPLFGVVSYINERRYWRDKTSMHERDKPEFLFHLCCAWLVIPTLIISGVVAVTTRSKSKRSSS